MKIAQRQARQGDVFFKAVDIKEEKPLDAKPVKTKNGKHILALGEVTGHAHVIEDAPKMPMFKSELLNRMFFSPEEVVTVRHDEHDPIPLAPGKMWVRYIQREFDERTMSRYVAD